MVKFSPFPPPFIVILTISPFIYIYMCVYAFFFIFDSSLSHRPTFHSIFTIFNNNNNNKPNISPSTRKAATCSGMGEKRREREKTGWQKEYTRRKWKLAFKKNNKRVLQRVIDNQLPSKLYKNTQGYGDGR